MQNHCPCYTGTAPAAAAVVEVVGLMVEAEGWELAAAAAEEAAEEPFFGTAAAVAAGWCLAASRSHHSFEET